MNQSQPLKVVIAGASGFVGSHLIQQILSIHPNSQVICLSRSKQSSNDARVHWKQCDLFSLESLQESIPSDVTIAIYLVHSMLPSASLDQGSFADYDLLLADNFARSLKDTSVQQIVYLGGLIPDTQELSLHLKSRQEVEEVLRQTGIPTTIFRTGLILGEYGSSFQILLKLVKRLPVMICPAWTQTRTTPVDIHTVTESMCKSFLQTKHFGKTYDLAGCKTLSYLEMMQETAKALGLKRYFLKINLLSPQLSKLWVSTISNTSKELVFPLIESLSHPMVAREKNLFDPSKTQKSFGEMIKTIPLSIKRNYAFFSFQARRHTVRSIQRYAIPSHLNAASIKDEYFSWLNNACWPWVRVLKTATGVQLYFFKTQLMLLEFTFCQSSTNDICKMQITSGFLQAKPAQGLFEFRTVLQNKYALVAIHDFKPALPWYLYMLTQAQLHLFVMSRFRSKLLRLQTQASKA
jgi:uncharacterized protein YbjT (DUF2867 family)